jgi:D-glycero-D-manno-heptose 1,7-bisphosphate phosphatase
MKRLHISRTQQKLGVSVVQSSGTWPLAGSLGIEESHEPKHFATAIKPTLSLVIFDRDGTLIEDTGFPIDPETIRWQKGALEAMAWLRSRGVIVAVATNQSGVARGYFTLDQVHAFHAAMDITIQVEGGLVARYAICPHMIGGAVAEYAVDCDCRKPKPGLINQILQQFQVRPECAVLIGDRETDLLAGQTAGVESFLCDGGDLFEFTRRVISAIFGLDAVDSVEATSKFSRS